MVHAENINVRIEIKPWAQPEFPAGASIRLRDPHEKDVLDGLYHAMRVIDASIDTLGQQAIQGTHDHPVFLAEDADCLSEVLKSLREFTQSAIRRSTLRRVEMHPSTLSTHHYVHDSSSSVGVARNPDPTEEEAPPLLKCGGCPECDPNK